MFIYLIFISSNVIVYKIGEMLHNKTKITIDCEFGTVYKFDHVENSTCSKSYYKYHLIN